jgi:pSer/pThr/pTyr-binding forkhead associated (FHA) protein
VTIAVTEAALATDETLLILKIAFLVLLYGFIVFIVRSGTKGIGGAPQESIILGAAEAAALRVELGVEQGARPARFVVLVGPGLREGSTVDVTAPSVVGREAESGIQLGEDEFASARHARIDPRADGVWVEDLGSTNGTFVNGERITAERLQPGDVVRVGETELRLEP